MKYLFIPFMTVIVASFATSARSTEPAEKPTHVVELFTSQGCSSCPPANRFVTKLSDDPSMLVLSYGVTYWDYLGWTDTFGDPEFTKRQREYRDAFGAANIYTPQIVLGGSAHSARYSKKDVAQVTLPEEGVGLSFTRSGDLLMIETDTDTDIIVDLVSFVPGEQSVDVKRGENRGREMKLTNVVTDIQTLDWKDQSATLLMPEAEGMQYAALIHDRLTARILDAAVLD